MGLKLISTCLYGSPAEPKTKIYYAGLMRNLKSMQKLLPDYKMMLFIPKGYHFLNEYADRILHAEYSGVLIIKEAISLEHMGARMMFYRFLPASYAGVDIFHSRDLDSPILQRDVEIVRAFEKSYHKAYCIRDHAQHHCRLLGGLWGAKSGAIDDMSDLVFNNIDIYPNEHYSDQYFLQNVVYKRLRDTLMVFDSFDHYPDEQNIRLPFPSKRNGDEFCGMSLDAEGKKNEEHHKIIRKSGR